MTKEEKEERFLEEDMKESLTILGEESDTNVDNQIVSLTFIGETQIDYIRAVIENIRAFTEELGVDVHIDADLPGIDEAL